jgi:hypothetical protein
MKYPASHLTALFPAFPGKISRDSFYRRSSTSTLDFQFPSVSPLSTVFTPNRLLSSLSTVFTHFDPGVGGAKFKKGRVGEESSRFLTPPKCVGFGMTGAKRGALAFGSQARLKPGLYIVRKTQIPYTAREMRERVWDDGVAN